MKGINLTPPQEIKERQTRYVVGASTKLAILLLLIAIGISGYYYLTIRTLKTQMAAWQTQSIELDTKVASMHEVEGFAKKLSGKYFLLQKYLESRLKYSAVMQELLARVPSEISFVNVTFEGMGKRAIVSGTSTDVVSVSAFVNQLAKEGNATSQSAVLLEGAHAFLDVRLDSLRVDEEKGVDYSVSFRINEEAFLK
ncbi:MAG: hypothetical protein ABIH84_01030 [bacterium]